MLGFVLLRERLSNRLRMDSTKKKPTVSVAMIEPLGGHGGMDYYDFGLCDGIASSGVSVRLYTCDETKEPEHANFVIKRPFDRIYGSSPKWLRLFRYIWGAIRAFYDVKVHAIPICHLHFFDASFLEAINVAFCRLLGLKIVITVHDVESFVGIAGVSKLGHWLYHSADLLIVHNQFSRLSFLNIFPDLADRVKIVPHGNYLHMIHPIDDVVKARQELALPLNVPILLFFGQIKTVKGLDLLLKALPDVVAIYPEVTVVIAGRVWKDDFAQYEQLIGQLGLSHNCVLHIRYIPNELTDLYFGSADVVILPYKKIYQSGVLLMAMSYGRAVIASDLPAMSEIISDKVNGYLFTANDSESLSQTILQAVAFPEQRNGISEQALRLMKQDFSWHEIGRKSCQLYFSLVS